MSVNYFSRNLCDRTYSSDSIWHKYFVQQQFENT